MNFGSNPAMGALAVRTISRVSEFHPFDHLTLAAAELTSSGRPARERHPGCGLHQLREPDRANVVRVVEPGAVAKLEARW